MARYVAFLGSINVGGNRLKMVDLRDALEREDFEDVETVVASGNVLFTHEERPSEGLAEKLSYVVLDRFGIDSFTAVRTREELAAAIAENPFAKDGEPNLVHSIFVDPTYSQADFAEFAASYPGPERVSAGTRAFHVDFVDGVARSRLGQAIGKRFQFRATARNIRSLTRILEKMT